MLKEKDDGEDDGGVRKSAVSPLAPQPGQVSSKINKRIVTLLMTGVEFSTTERAIRATESLESTIRGLCEGIASTPIPVIQVPQARVSTAAASFGDDRKTPERESSSALLAPPRTPPPRGKRIALPDISPNPFPEPETSLETYNSYIYGSVCVSNAVSTVQEKDRSERNGNGPHVTVLTARKKKKRAE
ncbi:hypothetical protein D9758_002561 [Tetrapyrgos nigripes]|uniref:Uncharacterized protein n=1 Tax=Tetrapyrgos nigripes TaxID=182062 RepID=A0A8H5GQY7_9AGAR|nr:hypothetical protein D9758_002561 [Tetrapyrgos nigripes]